MSKAQTIYVRLLDEGVDCWRPVDAVSAALGIFTITSINADPDDEHWEFGAGQRVICEERTLSGGTRLVAIRAVPNL